MLFLVATSFALMLNMSNGRYHVKDIAPHKPLLTYNNIYPNHTSNRIVNSGQPMVVLGGASPPISPSSHTSKKCL